MTLVSTRSSRTADRRPLQPAGRPVRGIAVESPRPSAHRAGRDLAAIAAEWGTPVVVADAEELHVRTDLSLAMCCTTVARVVSVRQHDDGLLVQVDVPLSSWADERLPSVGSAMLVLVDPDGRLLPVRSLAAPRVDDLLAIPGRWWRRSDVVVLVHGRPRTIRAPRA